MNFDDIFLFVRLVNTGTFTELAKQMNVSQSTVSRRIQNLEESITAKLIKRNSRGLIELTSAGEVLYRNFNNIEAQASDTLQKLLNRSREIRGVLKVKVPKLFFDNIIAARLDAFYTRYPNVKLVFTYTAGTVDLIKDNVDIAITTQRPQIQSCTVKTLIKAKNKLYAAKSYLKDKGAPKKVKDLENYNVVSFFNDGQFEEKLVGFSEKDNIKEEISIKPNLFLSDAMYDINLATKCKKIINTLDIFTMNNNDVEAVLEDYYFGETSFYLIRSVGVRNNLEEEFVKFINVCLQQE
ncbi:LysR family transcriptional regulator [Francisella hispaniensis]|uniref:LysR family transcriptional regulator n=1 Tax=Francisella hispaniensis TaxID=622488 RepID=UPI0019038C80|nr:LysR family transcriptional regulator [Francisella hispaniensis]MBK2357449.1 LysR family transcriptional regulator [Francisella hispaniensis]